MNPGVAMVDAHQHFWDTRLKRHPWLTQVSPIPFRYGDYSAIRRPYLPEDYFRDAGEFRVAATVYVETEWDPADPVGEMRFVETLRQATGYPTVAVAQAWLDRADAAEVLDAQAGFTFVRGIRHKPRANRSPRDGTTGGMADPAFRAGFARLAGLGLRFDLQTPWWHFHEAARLAADYPDTSIIVNHAGLPADRSAEGIAGWRSALRALAAHPNVALKISGIGVPGKPWTPALQREVVLEAIDCFGTARAMFASNFPVDSLVGTYRGIIGGFADIVADFSAADRRRLFRDNAISIYAIEGVPP